MPDGCIGDQPERLRLGPIDCLHNAVKVFARRAKPDAGSIDGNRAFRIQCRRFAVAVSPMPLSGFPPAALRYLRSCRWFWQEGRRGLFGNEPPREVLATSGRMTAIHPSAMRSTTRLASARGQLFFPRRQLAAYFFVPWRAR